MKQITIDVYMPKELPTEKAKARAYDWLGQIATELPPYYLEEAKHELAGVGFGTETDPAEINYTGFYCQGDGASFTCTVYLVTWIKSQSERVQKKFASLLPLIENETITARVYRTSHRYSHENTVKVAVDVNEEDEPVTPVGLVADLEREVGFDVVQHCLTIYRALRSEYEATTERANLDELAEANEWFFTADGQRV